MDPLHKLAEYFSKFPGIGPRQSRRFVYFLLGQPPHYLADLSKEIAALQQHVSICATCFRFFPAPADTAICSICKNPKRDTTTLLVVERDVDLESMEKSGAYQGLYFVLGNSVPILEKNPEHIVRSRELLERLKGSRGTIREIILAMSLNTEGEHTIDYLVKILTPLKNEKGFTLSTLGRGLSTGTELEYSDAATIKNALESRH